MASDTFFFPRDLQSFLYLSIFLSCKQNASFDSWLESGGFCSTLPNVNTNLAHQVPCYQRAGWGLVEPLPTTSQFFSLGDVDCFCHMTKSCKLGQICSSNLWRNRKWLYSKRVYSFILNCRPILFLRFPVFQRQLTIWNFLGFSHLYYFPPLPHLVCPNLHVQFLFYFLMKFSYSSPFIKTSAPLCLSSILLEYLTL